MRNKIIIFTDGASKGNPGPGGFGAVIVLPEDEVIELGGSEKHTTNNRMELAGAIMAFEEILKREEEILVYTESKYLIGGMTEWIVRVLRVMKDVTRLPLVWPRVKISLYTMVHYLNIK